MAKKAKRNTGLRVDTDAGVYTDRCIVFDAEGVPWVIDPHKGQITIAAIKIPAVDK